MDQKIRILRSKIIISIICHAFGLGDLSQTTVCGAHGSVFARLLRQKKVKKISYLFNVFHEHAAHTSTTKFSSNMSLSKQNGVFGGRDNSLSFLKKK